MSERRRRRDRSWDAGAIRRLREHIGLTQAQLAEELNTRQQTISEWERGAYRPRGPSARLLTRVAEDAAFPYNAGGAGGEAGGGADGGAGDRAGSGAGERDERNEQSGGEGGGDADR